MRHRFFPIFCLLLLGAGCAWLAGESDQLARIRPFSPSLLNAPEIDALHQFKDKAGGDRFAAGRIIAAFLPKALDRPTGAINDNQLHYRLRREELEKMLGQPNAIHDTGPSLKKARPGFVMLMYTLDVGQPLAGGVTGVGDSLWITVYKGWVVDCEIPAVITY